MWVSSFVIVLLIAIALGCYTDGRIIEKNQDRSRSLRFIFGPDVEVTVTPSGALVTTTRGQETGITTTAPRSATKTLTPQSNITTAGSSSNHSSSITTPLPNVNGTKETRTRCKLCAGSYCPFIEVDQDCPSGLCMSSVIDSKLGSREYLKSCVSLYECKLKAFDLSSDRCMDQYSQFRGPTFTDMTCHFCCLGDLCNDKVFPDQSKLYNFTSAIF